MVEPSVTASARTSEVDVLARLHTDVPTTFSTTSHYQRIVVFESCHVRYYAAPTSKHMVSIMTERTKYSHGSINVAIGSQAINTGIPHVLVETSYVDVRMEL